MSPEDQLREILHSEASTLVPSGDGLGLIRERVATRHRLQLLLLPLGALATVAAVFAFFTLIGSPATQQLVPPPVQPAATGTASSQPTAGAPVSPYTGPALWPFTSVQQGQDWVADHGGRPWAGDPVLVAVHLVKDLLKVNVNVKAGPHDPASSTPPALTLSLGGRDVGEVHVVRLFAGGPWTVVGVDGTDLTITTPTAGAAITSPTQVSGRITGVDENVQLQLITATGHELATAGAPAGTAMPWTGTLTWTDQTWFTAGIVGITRSPKDGAINRITVVAVKRA